MIILGPYHDNLHCLVPHNCLSLSQSGSFKLAFKKNKFMFCFGIIKLDGAVAERDCMQCESLRSSQLFTCWQLCMYADTDTSIDSSYLLGFQRHAFSTTPMPFLFFKNLPLEIWLSFLSTLLDISIVL